MQFIDNSVSSFIGTISGLAVISFLIRTFIIRWLNGYDKLIDKVNKIIELNPVSIKDCRKEHIRVDDKFTISVKDLYTKIDNNHNEVINRLENIKNGRNK